MVYIHLVEHSHSRIPVPSTFGPPSRVADGKTPLRENPEFCGMSAIASEWDALSARLLLDRFEPGGVLISIVSGEFSIGNKGAAMA